MKSKELLGNFVEYLHSNKLENLEEIDTFWETYALLKLKQEYIKESLKCINNK
jgi:hypothetical protein